MDAKRLLARLLEIAGDSGDYFVSGSLSFLPLLGNYRAPEQDVDAAIAREVFLRRRPLAGERLRVLTLPEVAVAGGSPAARWLAPRTAFQHLDTPDGLLDLSCYQLRDNSFMFSLGAGFAVHLPETIRQRFQMLRWEGVAYQAGPPELAFLPKAVWYLGSGAGSAAPRPEAKTLEDLRQLQKIVDWNFVRWLLANGGVRWRGKRLPHWLAARLDPFAGSDILSLRGRRIE